jgi:hypothetical protein
MLVDDWEGSSMGAVAGPQKLLGNSQTGRDESAAVAETDAGQRQQWWASFRALASNVRKREQFEARAETSSWLACDDPVDAIVLWRGRRNKSEFPKPLPMRLEIRQLDGRPLGRTFVFDRHGKDLAATGVNLGAPELQNS